MRRAASSLLVSLAVVTAAAACSLATSLEGYAGPEPTTDDASTPPAEAGRDAAEGGPIVEAGKDPSYREVVLSDSPLAYYRLDDTGSVAKDEVGAHDGTYKGAVTHAKGALAGDSNGATVFDGSAYVEVGEVFPFLGTSPFSVEAWASPDDATNEPYCIAAKNIPGDGGGVADGYTMFLDDTQPNVPLFSRYGGGSNDTAAGPALTKGTFTHVVATYDGQTMTLYVNGERAGQKASTRMLLNAARPLTLAASRGGTFCRFHGALDEIAIYGIALPEDRIRAHHTAGLKKP